MLEVGEDRGIDSELPVQITTHLPLHLIDFPQREHILRHYTPGLVGIGVVADDLRSDHVG